MHITFPRTRVDWRRVTTTAAAKNGRPTWPPPGTSRRTIRCGDVPEETRHGFRLCFFLYFIVHGLSRLYMKHTRAGFHRTMGITRVKAHLRNKHIADVRTTNVIDALIET